MSASQGEILHVSDTALMVSACRAMETERPDGLVRDPFAARLAGDRGMAIARAIPRLELLCFGVAVRTRFLDDLVAQVVTTRGVRTVISVGAGLDSRPWRLELPQSLRWIEADFPAMLDYKASVLASEKPKCRLERAPADLTDASQRQAIFSAAGSDPALMITEGLLIYLPSAAIEALASEPVLMSGIRYWLLDLASPALARAVRMDSMESIDSVRAPGHLDGLQTLDVIRRRGWTSLVHRSYVTDAAEIAAARIQSMAAGRPAAEPMTPPPPDDPSGVHLFGRE
jgi:methyltransferase (TIGR00027 family)